MLSESASRRLMRALLLLATLLTTIFAATVLLRPLGAYLPWADGGIFNLIPFLTIGVLILRARLRGFQARAWGIIAAAYLFYALGEFWLAEVGRWDEQPPLLPIHDALFLVSHAMVLWAIGHLTNQVQRPNRNFLDALVLGSGGFVILALLLQAGQTGLSDSIYDSKVVLTGIYAGVNLIMLVFGLLLFFVQDFRLSPGWWLLSVWLIAIALTDTLYWIQLASGTYIEGDWLDLGWLVAHLAMAGAALMGLPAITTTASRTLRGILPVSLSVIIAVIALNWGSDGFYGLFARVAATATLFLALARLTYAIRDAITAEAATLASRDRFEHLLRSAPVPMGLKDARDNILLVNDEYQRLFGFTREEVPTLWDWYRRVYPDPAYRRLVRRTWGQALRMWRTRQGTIGPLEFQITRGDGEIRQVEISAVGLDGGLLTAFIDVTARKAAEERLIQAQHLAEEASRAKSEFLAHMSHEIRTPLYSVLGLAQMVGREPLSANQRDLIDRIQEAGQTLLGIISDILDLSRIEAGKLAIEFQPLDLQALLTKLDGLLAPKARAEGLVLKIPRSPAALGLLQGDPLRLEQVLTNLIGNAIKFTDSGTIEVAVQILAQSDKEVRLRFAVHDPGIGIAPEVLAGLFTPFTQGDSRVTRAYGGTGLGLAISKRLVELMGGQIGAESQPGQGSTFWFEIPLHHTPGVERVVPTGGKATPNAGPALDGWRFLVVDDSDTHRELLSQTLTLEGATVTTAANGQQAVHCLESAPEGYDVVLMDMQMPVMDGLTATRLIRGPLGLGTLPVIALTAGVLPEQRQAAREAGVDAVLTKPLDLDQIATLLRQWLPTLGTPHGLAEVAGVAAEATPPGAEAELEAATSGTGMEAKVKALASRMMADMEAEAAESGAEAKAAAARTETEAKATTSGAAAVDFPLIPGINGVKAARLYRGNQALFLKLLAGLAPKFGGVVAATRADLARGERDAAARRMHQLRGHAANLCAQGLTLQAGWLEEAILSGATDLEERLGDLDLQLAALCEASAA